MNRFSCYGYLHDENGHIMLNREEADVVRLIFQLRVDGFSLRQISSELERRNIASPSGKNKWSIETLRHLLRNEKYTGHVILQKKHAVDFFSGNSAENAWRNKATFIADHHAAIIPPTLFLQAHEPYRQNASSSDRMIQSALLRIQEYQCCQEYLHGNKHALDDLYEQNYPRIVKYIGYLNRRHVLKKEDAEDLIQDIALRSVQYLSSYNGNYRFWSWLDKITLGEFCRAIQKMRKRYPELLVDDFDNSLYRSFDWLRDWESDQMVRYYLGQVPAKYRDIIIKKAFFGIKLIEITCKTGIPRSTVSLWYRNGLSMIGDMVE